MTKTIRSLKKESLERLFLLIVGFTIILYGRWTIMGSPPVFQKIDNPASFLTSPVERVRAHIYRLYFYVRLQFSLLKIYRTIFQFLNYSYIYLINILIMICPIWLCFDWSMGCIPLIRLNEFPDDPRFFVVSGFWIILVLAFYKLLYLKNCDQK